MPELTHQIDRTLESPDGETFRLRTAAEEDMDEIKGLYFEVYGGNYTLPEVNNTDKMKWAIHDPNYIWLLCEKDGSLLGSVVFLVDEKNRLGKTFAGVVLPQYRGHKIMKNAIRQGIQYSFYDKNLCDVLYGVVRTFVTRSFHDDLRDLGFIDMGIFPNVRKISKYETHGLKVLFKDEALQQRRKTPQLIEPSRNIYNIVQEKLGLEDSQLIPYKYNTPQNLQKFEFYMEKSPDIEWEYYKKKEEGLLSLSVFPFHYPEMKLYTKDKKTQAYIHYEERDGHADLMGLETDQPHLLTDILESIAEYADSMGVKYMELLLDAHNPQQQMRAYEADFLPCAYFPAIIKTQEGDRQDYVVTCRTFVPLDFKGMKLTDSTRDYVRAYYKMQTTKLWEDLEHA